MPSTLDAFTLLVIAAAVSPLIAAAQIFLWWQTRDRALAWWAAGSFSLALGTLMSLDARAPASLWYLASSASLVFGHAMLLRGIWVFQRGQRGDQAARRVGWPLFALGVVVLVLADYAFVDTLLAPLLIAVVSAGCAYLLACRHCGDARASSYFTAGVFAASAAIHVAFTWLVIAVPAAHADWRLLRVADFLLLIGWSFGFLMLIGQRNQERIADLANHDELTGLERRRSLLEKGRQLYGLAERSGAPLAVMMLDIDLFKQVNDTFGHAAGDDVLRRFASTVSTCLRDTDVFGRLGGEEFCVILPDTEIEGALGVAERCRSAVAAARFEWRSTKIDLTVSIGVAHRDETTADLDTLIGRADEALYRAKQGGRNRVCRAEPSVLRGPVVRLVWDGRYRSGNATIDREHEYLFERANTLLARLQREADGATIAGEMKEVMVWLSAHFRHEERILDDAGWAGLAEHAALHYALEERGRRLLTEIEAGMRNSGELLDFLVIEVIARHLAQHDIEYFAELSRADAAATGANKLPTA